MNINFKQRIWTCFTGVIAVELDIPFMGHFCTDLMDKEGYAQCENTLMIRMPWGTLLL